MSKKHQYFLWISLVISFLILVDLYIPGIYPSIWTLLIIPAILTVIVFPSWKVAVSIMVLLSSIKYCVEFIKYDGAIPYERLVSLLINSIVNYTVFLTMTYFRIKYEQIAEDLKYSEERYRQLVEHAPEMIAIHDGGKLVYINQAGVDLFGAKHSAELLERTVLELVHPEFHQQLKERAEKVRSIGQMDTIEYKIIRLDGKIVDVEVTSSLIHYMGSTVIQSIGREITARKEYQEKLEFLAHHDSLTQLPNRRLFLELLEQNIKQAKRFQNEFAVMYMDIDDFKRINDHLGHEAGDMILEVFAQRLKSSIRESDIAARLAGDEFIVLLPIITDKEDIMRIANRIISSMEEKCKVGIHDIHITLSIGIALCPAHGQTTQTLIKNADTALYKAKQQGKNHYQFYKANNNI